MPNPKELQVQQRKSLIKYLRLQEVYPNDLSLKKLIEDTEAEMDDEDVLRVRSKLFEDDAQMTSKQQ